MANPLIDLVGQRLLVMGAGAGIGASVLELALEAGAHVAATVMDTEQAAGAAAVQVCDVTDPHAVTQAVDASADALGGLDAVILTAGVFDFRGVEETSDADWRRVMSINLDGPFHVARAAAPHLRQTKGALVLFSSQVGLIGHPRATSYAASKSAVNGLVRTLAVEFAPWGGRVNAVAPGPIETGMTKVARTDPTRRDGLLKSIPLNRFGQPQEVARAALFLAAPGVSFVTGHVLVIDGGVTAI
ncbi:SDR family NAD(P)-dependent oxidoreductase [Puniceibacterium sp. IMCC21224]|uniref:SDR family NAD(P)-dependent oxidoreductase n=1 Tax=Puniceibacterium sp. IMCC21224 TaxID=1618204 RepID=UPI00064DDB8E|nr:SDR family NAD(P)-dependent oxidoreductase [Puniceibacterium sp. IMCC21224]KMK64914.1 dehydrogenase of unknown specificity, short-chain alcohol dehydrogenase like [Puniceibacterium sp. IMCC21224]